MPNRPVDRLGLTLLILLGAMALYTLFAFLVVRVAYGQTPGPYVCCNIAGECAPAEVGIDDGTPKIRSPLRHRPVHYKCNPVPGGFECMALAPMICQKVVVEPPGDPS